MTTLTTRKRIRRKYNYKTTTVETLGQDHKPATMQNDGVGNPSVGGIKELQDKQNFQENTLKTSIYGENFKS